MNNINPATVIFIKASDSDWPILLEMEKSEIGNTIYAPETNMNEFKKFFANSVLYKVFVQKKLAGYCGYERRKNEDEIMGLLVLKPFRNMGVGDLMLNKMLNDLKSIHKIKLSTSPKNTVAIQLYLKNGFVITEKKDNYWQGQPRLILYKE